MDRERVALPGVEDELILADEARRSVSGDDEDRVVDLLRRPAGGREANRGLMPHRPPRRLTT